MSSSYSTSGSCRVSPDGSAAGIPQKSNPQAFYPLIESLGEGRRDLDATRARQLLDGAIDAPQLYRKLLRSEETSATEPWTTAAQAEQSIANRAGDRAVLIQAKRALANRLRALLPELEALPTG